MNPFQLVDTILPQIPGWCCKEKAEALIAMVLAIRPSVSVEIGVFGGSSFIPIALAHKHLGWGVVIGIDPWSARESTKNQAPEHAEWWAKQDHETIYQRFMATLKYLSLEKYCQIWRKTSDASTPPQQIDLLHIDGNHSEQALRDVVRFAIKIRPGGFCVLDDLDWTAGNVRLAESRLLQLGFKMLYAVGTGAVYQRV